MGAEVCSDFQFKKIAGCPVERILPAGKRGSRVSPLAFVKKPSQDVAA